MVMSIRIIVKGKVQDVLIEVYGESAKVEELFQWSLKGPMLAQVKSVHREEIESIPLDGNFVFRK